MVTFVTIGLNPGDVFEIALKSTGIYIFFKYDIINLKS